MAPDPPVESTQSRSNARDDDGDDDDEDDDYEEARAGPVHTSGAHPAAHRARRSDRADSPTAGLTGHPE